MAYDITLALHILGGIATGVVGAYALALLWNRTAEKYRVSALVLGGLAAFEVFSGTLLAVLSIELSVAAVCSRIALYLSLVALIELVLFMRMKNLSLLFPLRAVISPIAASCIALLSALAYGF